MVVWYLGWVDSGLECSLGFLAATVATYCPGRMVGHPKTKSPQPGSQTYCHPVETFVALQSSGTKTMRGRRSAEKASGHLDCWFSAWEGRKQFWIPQGKLRNSFAPLQTLIFPLNDKTSYERRAEIEWAQSSKRNKRNPGFLFLLAKRKLKRGLH